MKFFRVLGDPALKGGWFPDDPITEHGAVIDAREFTQGRLYCGPRPNQLPVAQEGRKTEFTLAAFDMPVISRRVGQVLDSICTNEIQRFPVIVDSPALDYEILNVTSSVACLDENYSQIMKWTAEDGRPEKVGNYRMITNLTIIPSLVGHKHIFRVKGWKIALIVSDTARHALTSIPHLGVIFNPVS